MKSKHAWTRDIISCSVVMFTVVLGCGDDTNPSQTGSSSGSAGAGGHEGGQGGAGNAGGNAGAGNSGGSGQAGAGNSGGSGQAGAGNSGGSGGSGSGGSGNGGSGGGSGNGGPQLDGTFLWYIPVGATDLNTTFNYLSEIGMHTVVFQLTSHRYCASAAYTANNYYSPANLEAFLAKAQTKGVNVYVGLNYVLDAWNCKYYAPSEAQKAKTELSSRFPELFASCNKYTSCKGWYLPDEPNLVTLPSNQTDLNNFYAYYKDQVNIIKAIDSQRSVLIAPYMHSAANPTTLANNALSFKNATGVNIEIVQDSVGYSSTNLGWRAGAQVRDFFAALHGTLGKTALWGVIELPNNGPAGLDESLTPASTHRVRRQLEHTCPTPACATSYVSNRIGYLASRHLSNVALGANNPTEPEAARAFAGYKAIFGYTGSAGYVEKLLVPSSYFWSTAPDTYLDAGNEMFDALTADPINYLDSGWAGVPSWVSNGSQLVITFPKTQTINWLGVHMLNHVAGGIYIPDIMKLECIDSGTVLLGQWNRPSYISPKTETTDGEYVFSNPTAINKTCKKVVLTLVGNQGWHLLSEVEFIGK